MSAGAQKQLTFSEALISAFPGWSDQQLSERSHDSHLEPGTFPKQHRLSELEVQQQQQQDKNMFAVQSVPACSRCGHARVLLL